MTIGGLIEHKTKDFVHEAGSRRQLHFALTHKLLNFLVLFQMNYAGITKHMQLIAKRIGKMTFATSTLTEWRDTALSLVDSAVSIP